MKLRMILLSAFVLFATALSAQSFVMGKVVEQSTSDPVPGAVVALIENDTAVVAQTQTAPNGVFSFKTAGGGRRLVRVTMLGYESAAVAVIGEGEKIDLGYVFLTESSVQLDEVTVYGSGIIEKIDKYVVLPSAGQLDRSAQTIDLFSQLDLPGLRTDPILRSIKVEDRNPVYQINGREQPLSRILNLNPKDILRIEYSNNPGIRYIDKGYSGVINVVLRERPQGGSVNLQANSSLTTKRINGGLQATYNYKKSEFTLSYFGGWHDYAKGRSFESESYVLPDGTIGREQEGFTKKICSQSHGVSLEYNFAPEINTLFSVRASGNFSDSQNDNYNRITERPWKGTPYDFEQVINGKSNGATPSLDLFFTKRMRHRQTIELSAAGGYSDYHYERPLRYVYGDGSDLLIRNATDHQGWFANGEAVWNKEFKRIVTRFGVQHSFNRSENDYVDGQNALQTNHNTYVYGELRGKIKKVSYSLGTGLKVFDTENNTMHKTHLTNNTVVNVLYPMGKGWSLNYLLTYQPNIPSLSDLSPVSTPVNDRINYSGNPNLRPSNWFFNRALIRYNNNKGMTWAFWLRYGRVFNPIVGGYDYDAAKGVMSHRPDNQNYDDELGVQVNFGYQNLWNHVNIFAECGYGHFETDGHNYHHTHNNFFSSLNLNVFFGRWLFSGSVTITPKSTLSGELLTKYGRNSNLGIQYKIANNFYVYASYSYMFQRKGYISESENLSSVRPAMSRFEQRHNANMVQIGLTYNLNFGKRLNKRSHKWGTGNQDSGIKQF